MIKAIFPLIFLMAFELTPVVKTYGDIKARFSSNLSHIIPQVQLDQTVNSSNLANQLELQKNVLATPENSQPDYVF